MNKTYRRCVAAYNYMRQHSVVRTGSWLEGHDFPIEYLSSFDDEVPIYYGRVSDVGAEIGVTNASILSDLTSTMQACGWIYKYQKGMYALVREPTEKEFKELKTRKAITNQGSVRRDMEEQLAIIHRRLDDVVYRLQQLENNGN